MNIAARTVTSGRLSSWGLAATALAIAVVVLLACYWQTVRSLVWLWGHDGTYQYAFLIFPLSAWTAFNLRHRVRANVARPSIWGAVAVAVLVAIWYTGRLFDVNLPQHFALVAMFPALVLAFWGWRALWTLKFPLGYLVFAVPWGDGMVGSLQDFTARFAVHALELTGTPVLLNGREIVTPSAVWMVADACSGVRFFIACTALGCLYSYLMYRRWWKRVLFVALAAVVPIIANGFRVYFTILIGETWGLKYATGTDHMVFGWQFFGTVLILLLLVGWFFRDRLVLEPPPPPSESGPVDARTATWPVVLALLIAGPVAAAGMLDPAPLQSLHVEAPVLAGWSGPRAAQPGWHPTFKGAAGQVQATYRLAADGATVELFHAVYLGKPERGNNMITYGNDVYDPGRERILAASPRQIEFAGATVTARELRIVGDGGPRLVWYWYCVNRHCTASPILTKLLQAWTVMRGRVPRSVVWALSSPIDYDDPARTRKVLSALSRELPATDTSGPPFEREHAATGKTP